MGDAAANGNARYGRELVGYLYDTITVEDREAIKKKMDMATMSRNQFDEGAFNKLFEEIQSIDKRTIFVFKLIEPIPFLEGTLSVTSGTKTRKMSLSNVTTINIDSTLFSETYMSAEETGNTEKNVAGKDVDVVKLKLDKCMLDIMRPIIRGNNFVIPATAYITVVEASILSQLGSLTARRERNDKEFNYFNQ